MQEINNIHIKIKDIIKLKNMTDIMTKLIQRKHDIYNLET